MLGVNEVLLRTKLTIPPARPSAVARPRLIDKLTQGTAGKLTLVSAPAGFGKTTLIAEWARTAERQAPMAGQQAFTPQICWLTLTGDDNDLARFLTYIMAAIKTLGAPWSNLEVDEELVALHLNARPPEVETLLMILINALMPIPQHCVLVLDDYQAIRAREIHRALDFLLTHMPANMHLVIGTRVDPPLPLPRLRARGQLTEIRQRDLRFSREEAALFLEGAMGLSLASAEIEALATRTEGWAAGLQLAAISLQASADHQAFVVDFAGSHRHILDYLGAEVLEHQTPAIRTFLLRTAVLERLTAPLCAALLWDTGHERDAGGLDMPPAAMILEQLEASNLFIFPLDEERRWFRYHRLFADLLRFTLRNNEPEIIPALHRRAALWFVENGLEEEAIAHALAAADYQLAARLVERNAEKVLMRSEIGLLLRWLDALPGELIQARPVLGIYHAWALLLSGRPLVEVRERLNEAEKEGLPGELSAVAAMFRAFLALLLGDARRCLDLAARALADLPAARLAWRGLVLSYQGMALVLTGDFAAAIDVFEESIVIGQEAGSLFVLASGLTNLAGLHLARGQQQQAAALYRQALDVTTGPEGRRLPIAHRALLGLGELAREGNDLEAAARYFQESLALARQYGNIGPLLSLLHLARVQQTRGDIAGADALLENARQLARKSDATPIDDQLVALTQVRLWLQRGDFIAAGRWARTRGGDQPPAIVRPADSGKPPPIHDLAAVEQLLLARLAIAQGQPGQALTLLKPLEEDAARRDLVGRMIEIRTLQALAREAQGETAQALNQFQQALTLAEPAGYIRVFADFGAPLLPLLRLAQSRGITVGYCGRLLAAISGPETPSTPAATPLVEPLSERELEVLTLIAAGLTNREIAERLVISLSTVKGHTANIYSKLGTHRRTQAVARAQELGLLP